METIDITFDFETCALCPTAAVMSMGAVAWKRDGKETPFFVEEESESIDPDYTFTAHVDLRGMFIDGFTFDANTAQWWGRQSDEARSAIVEWDAEDAPCWPIQNVIKSFFAWIKDMKTATGADDVFLWSQGSDFDIAILRNICHKYDIEIPVSYKNFRDHRTCFMEGAKFICDVAGTEYNEDNAYSLVDAYDGEGEKHTPVFDCASSIFATWQMMKYHKCFDSISEND